MNGTRFPQDYSHSIALLCTETPARLGAGLELPLENHPAFANQVTDQLAQLR